MNDYVIPGSNNITGAQMGFSWLQRVSQLTLTAAMNIDWHSHAAIEILGCLHGSLEYEFAGRASVVLQSGSFLVVPPRLPHRITGGCTTPSRRFSVFLRTTLPRHSEFTVFTPAEYRDLLVQLLSKRLTQTEIPAARNWEMTALADGIVAWGQNRGKPPFALRTALLSALGFFASAYRAPRSRSEEELIREACSWLRGHAAEDVALDDLVAHIGYGRSRFFQLFRKQTGVTPLEWLNRHRIDRASQLLLRRTDTIAAIARTVGLPNTTYFARLFRRYTGTTPHLYATSGTQGPKSPVVGR